MAAWIKMPLGVEVDLGPGDMVLDGDSASPSNGGAVPPILGHVYCGQTAEWIRMPRSHCVREEPSPPRKGHTPNFRSVSIEAKRSPISATDEHLLFRLQFDIPADSRRFSLHGPTRRNTTAYTVFTRDDCRDDRTM